tara:strand:- start:1252 stop:1452 length:201 start_codon:yes stop_codon:yes gene_type:complete
MAKETVAELNEQAPEHAADAAGMLEALISAAIGALAAEQGAAYAKNFIDYEVGSINVQHMVLQRLT